MRGNNNNKKNNPGKIYSANPNNYKLLEEVGHGASATVFRAIYRPLNEVVAVKCLDLDRCNSNFDDIRREAQTMHLIDHPNVVRSYCSFVVERSLWVIMPFMAEGSCLHLMKIAYPDGFEEVVIGSILKETLKALVYLHQQGHIHRDVKADNILLDTNGMVKLADLGVSACMFDAGDRRRSRNTFTGTPCWMAPEVLQPGSGYNSKADIWSFGITALELAHGHAPFSKYPPMKVLLMTIQNAPPGLDYDRDKKFSKAFKEMVAMCLVKDQTKRPTAEKLLKHSFFKTVKPLEFSLKKLFTDLPPLWTRVKSLQAKDAAQLALKKMPSAEQEAMSQSEYQRGVSAWNFDVEDLKAQASLVRDDDDEDDLSDIINAEEKSKGFSYKVANDWKSSLGKLNEKNDGSSGDCKSELNSDDLQQVECSNRKGKNLEDDLPECGSQLATDRKDGSSPEALVSTSVTDIGQAVMPRVVAAKSRQSRSGPLTPGAVLNHSLSDAGRNPERHGNENQSAIERAKAEVKRTPSFSGPLMLPNRASANSFSAPIKSSGGYRDSLDDKSKVQIKGRFSVTSENLDLVKDIPSSIASRQTSQGSPLRKSASVGDWVFDVRQMPGGSSPKELNNSSDFSASLISHLQNLSQQLSIQQDMIMNVLSVLQPTEIEAVQNGKLPQIPRSSENNGSVEPVVSERERLLLLKISELQLRMNNSNDELAAEKMREAQLTQQLNALSEQEENGDKR